MATEVKMPKMGYDMEEGTILSWSVAEGDKVAKGDVLGEIETGKVTIEIEAFDAGVLLKILVPVGNTVPVGAPIAIIGAEGEEYSLPETPAAEAKSEPPTAEATTATQPTDAKPESVPTDGMPESVPTDGKTEPVPTDAKPESVPTDGMPESAPAAATSASPLASETSAATSTAGSSNGADQPANVQSSAGESSTTEPSAGSESEATVGPSAGASSTGTPVAADSQDGRLRASPLARRIATEHGVDLSAVHGSGPSGRIVRDDVQTAIDTGVTPAPAPAPATDVAAPAPGLVPAAAPALPGSAPGGMPSGATPISTGPETQREDLSRIRRTIAARLGQSWQAAPHIFLTMAIELDAALALREQVNAALAATGGGKVSVNDLVVKASALALRKHPLLNVSWDDGQRVRHGRVNVGVAVALNDGLMTVTIADADSKPLSALSSEVADKANRAREGKLTADDLATPSTFTVSNLGMFGIEHFTAILNPPEAGILAVGAGKPTAVVRDGEIVARTMMNVTLSADHRVVDGAMAAEFLVTLKSTLENPLTLLI